ncbi:MAG: BatD family protein [Myxococcota bacterium]
MTTLLVLVSVAGLDSVQATLDRTTAAVGDNVTLTVLIDGTQAREPKISRVPGLQFYGPRTSRVRQNINGVVTETIGFRYTVVPKKPGTYRIPPIVVRARGAVHRSLPLTLKVSDGESSDIPIRPFFAVATIDNSTPYRSQQIVYSIQLYGELLNLTCKRFELPKFDKFIVEDLGQERSYQTVKNGRRFSVVEVKKSLFPLEAGTFTLPATELTCNVTYPSTPGGRIPFGRLFSRGRTETKILRTEEITLKVKALPPAPADFSNVVGRVQVGASIDTRVLPAGSSVTQTLYVKSSGALRGLVPPPPKLENVKIYDDQPKLSFNDRGAELESVMRMNRAFVPTEPGRVRIPAFTVSYFDPESAAYARATAPAIDLRVTPSRTGEDLKLVDGTGIAAANAAPPELTPEPAPLPGTVLAPRVAIPILGIRAPPAWLVLLASAFPPLLILAGRLGRATQRIRLRRPESGPLRRVLAPLQEHHGSSADVVERVIREVLARSGDPSLERSSADGIDTALSQFGVAEPDRVATQSWLHWTESARWGGAESTPPSSANELSELLSRIDRSFRI